MTAYRKRLLLSGVIVVGAFVPAMVPNHPSVILYGPWCGLILATEELQAVRGWDLSGPYIATGMGILTLTILALTARSVIATVLAVVFFLWNAAVLYQIMEKGLGGPRAVPPNTSLQLTTRSRVVLYPWNPVTRLRVAAEF